MQMNAIESEKGIFEVEYDYILRQLKESEFIWGFGPF